MAIMVPVVMVCPCAWGQYGFQFVDVAAERGIEPHSMTEGLASGLSAADIDNDGDVDVFVPNGPNRPDQLYLNLGNGTFEEIAATAGVDSAELSRCAVWFDYDADGDLDLFVANDDPDSSTKFRLYRQQAGLLFEEVTAEAGLIGGNDSPRGGVCVGDINRDGYLDLYAVPWGGTAHLYLNNTDGTFTEISESSGVDNGFPLAHWQPVMVDLDMDGWLDIYQALDVAPNNLWLNQQNNTFVESAQMAGLANPMNDMGVTLGDYDNDGDLDIYVSNIIGSPFGGRNVLFRNDSEGSLLDFTEVSQDAQVDDGGWGWGVTFFDVDNDGLLDIAATNGFTGAEWEYDVSKLFRNLGGDPVVFEEIATRVGFDDTYWGSALVAFDYDRDGDLDVMQSCVNGPVRLLQNQPSAGPSLGHYLTVKPRMDGPNHWSIGAVVHLEAGDLSMMRLMSAGTSFMGQEPAEAFFGLGDATIVDRITVDWPDGTQTTVVNVSADQIITITNDPPTVVELSISGSDTVVENTSAVYGATATYTDGSSESATGDTTWTVTDGSVYAAFGAPGTLEVGEVASEVTITIQAEFDTLTATKSILLLNTDYVDTQAPTLSITSPTTEPTLTTNEESIEVTGMADDDIGVVSVVWSNDRTGTGPCGGMNPWTTGPVYLLEGLNTIVITATDASQNASSTELIVERLLPEESGEPTEEPEEPPDEDESDPPDEESGDDPSNDTPPDDDEGVPPPILDDPPAVDPSELNDPDPDETADPLGLDDVGETPGDAAQADDPPAPSPSDRRLPGDLCGALGMWHLLWLTVALGWPRRSPTAKPPSPRAITKP
ncbi:MAG: CRTAC1 family protein [Planctomycetes bacterium]|nr:CRTAC1 family protein [Planctomycetota bacterium]